MAPLPVIPSVIRAAFTWTSSEYTRHSVNVMHFESDGSDIDALHTQLEAAVTVQMWSHTPNTSHITSIRYTPLDGLGASIERSTTGGSKWSGNGTPGTTTPQVAAIIKLLTDARGRSFRGRVYLPWVGEGDATSGILSSIEVTALQGAWTTFRGAMAGAGFPLKVASYKLSSAANVSSIVAESQLATQRRRQPRPT